MDALNVVSIGAVVGMAASYFATIKNVIWKAMNLVVRCSEIDENSGTLRDALMSYIVKNFKRSVMYDGLYCSTTSWVKSQNCNLEVPYEYFGKKSIVFWNGWVPFLVTPSQTASSGSSSAPGGSGSPSSNFRVTYIRGTLDMDAIVREAVKIHNEAMAVAIDKVTSNHRRFFIHSIPNESNARGTGTSSAAIPWFRRNNFRLIDRQADDIGPQPNSKEPALSRLFFPDRIKGLIEEIKRWHMSKEWYKERGIPWKSGWLLYGPPGTGKSALARAMAEDEDIPIFSFALAELTNTTFSKAWKDMLAHAPCMALIEDIDNVFHGRENVARRGMFPMFGPKKDKKGKDSSKDKGDDDDGDDFSGGRLTFDSFLNTIDGVDRAEGVFLVITTNELDKVDPALGVPRKLSDGTIEFISTRPGRIDKAIELGCIEKPQMYAMADRILDGFPIEIEKMKKYIASSSPETPAQFQLRCVTIALKCFWDAENARKKLEEQMKDINTVSDIAKEAGSVTQSLAYPDGTEVVAHDWFPSSESNTTLIIDHSRGNTVIESQTVERLNGHSSVEG
jgi:ATPase family associated with various cellular activities (AAA)